MSDNITLPRKVVEKAIKAFENGCSPTCENGMIDSGGFHPWGEPMLDICPACLAFEHLRAALRKPSEDIDALRRDAERYRWLRGEHSRIDPCITANAKYRLERNSSTWVEIHDLDAAIDAAMEDKT